MATFTGTAFAATTTLVQCSSWMQFWGKAFLALGWKQTTDTGQLNQLTTVFNISQVASSAGNSVYTYDATTMLGPAPLVGQAVCVSGFATGGNNITLASNGIITALGGSGAASTFTVVTTTQTNETHAAGGGISRQFNVSQVASSGGNSVYTYNAAAISGPALRVGMAVWVTGFATGGNNVSNRPIIALGGSGASSTFTLATTTQGNETHAALVFDSPFVIFSTALNSSVGQYEIFQSQDALSSSCPITVRIDYAISSGTMLLFFCVGLGGTNGAGVFNAPNTAVGGATFQLVGASPDAVSRSCYASGDGGNIRILLNTGGTIGAANMGVFFCVSRAYDGTGAQLNTYVMVWAAVVNKHCQQSVFLSGALGPLEAANWIGAVGQTASQSQGFGGNVAVSPAYQVVGGFNNPSPDVVIGKTVDFTNNTQVTVSFYNVNHNYLVENMGGNASVVSGIACSILMRYE